MSDEGQELPCAEKMVFETKKEAEGVALAVDWQRGTPLKAYKCQHCGLWHLSSA
jgi:hypothetical protein